MGTYEELKTAIRQVIRTNGNNEITGANLQNVLLSIINVVGANATFAGIATPNTEPGTAEQNVFYLATEAGTYVNFGGIVINEREAVILSNKKGKWVKTISGLATQQQVGRKAEALFSNAELNELIKEIYVPSSFDYTQVTRVRVVVGYLAGSKYYNAIYLHASDNSKLLQAQKTFSTLEDAINNWNAQAIFYIEDTVYALVVPTTKSKEIDFRNEQLLHPLTLDFAPSIASQLALRNADRVINIENVLQSCAREYRGVNMFDKRRVNRGYIADNGIVESSSYYYSIPLYCKPGRYKQTLSTSLGSRVVYAICTESGEILSIHYSSNEDGYYIIEVDKPCYIMTNIGKVADLNQVMFCEYDRFPLEYTPYVTSLEYSNIPIENVIGIDSLNPLIGKKMLVCGDSIAYGGGRGFGLLIGEKNAMQVTTNAIDGAIITIERSDSTKPRIYQQLLNGAEGMDYILFDGGVNDMLLDNLGEISNSFTAEFDESTFCGSFEKIISTMIAKYPTAKMGYVAVHRIKQWKDDNYTAWQDTGYYTKAIAICRKWGIPVCDLTHEVPSLYEITALKNAYTRNQDGWHPTEEGYRIFYCDKVEAFMRSL